VFSTAALVQSKLRNRLQVPKVGRLVKVSRVLCLDLDKEKQGEKSENRDLEEAFEDE